MKRKSMKRKSSKSIRSQIFHGYQVTILITICLVALFVCCMGIVNMDYEKLNNSRENQSSTQEAITAHYQWLDKFNVSLNSGEEFTGSLDYKTCALGSWMSNTTAEDLQDPTIADALSAADAPHQSIHNIAQGILDLAKSDQAAAAVQYKEQIEPQTRKVIEDLTKMTDRYKQMSQDATKQLSSFIVISIILVLILAGVSVTFSIIYARKIANKISKPIVAVADWSKKLSRGDNDLKMDDGVVETDDEIGSMIKSFHKMASSVKDNVDVVSRVAKGDLTAYVNVRSREDALGKSLYKMVQTNDIMFNEIVHIAYEVASGAEQIASASQALAQSATLQATAVEGLSDTIDVANDMIIKNAESTDVADGIATSLRDMANKSSAKMRALVEAVEEINASAQRISVVNKTVEDIAFQTNILALNAAVEAARAGDAGKGFAVVAGEVRQLALSSAQAVTDSKHLIDDTIIKVKGGSVSSAEAYALFQSMIKEIDEIVRLVEEIATASGAQLEGIGMVRRGIADISQATTTNAAISEESAAASEEMSASAAMLKESMSKFNLRQRQDGRAYIPPEKKNDPNFITRANENYKLSKQLGRPTENIAREENEDNN